MPLAALIDIFAMPAYFRLPCLMMPRLLMRERFTNTAFVAMPAVPPKHRDACLEITDIICCLRHARRSAPCSARFSMSACRVAREDTRCCQ